MNARAPLLASLLPLLLAAGAGAASGCGTDAAPDDAAVGTQVGCIYGGTPAPGALGLAPAEANAVADLEIAGGDGNVTFGGRCTGVLVADAWVLTAAHCTPDPASTRVTARFGSRPSCQVQAAPVGIASAEVVAHPALDLMLVRLAEPPGRRTSVAPVEIDTAAELLPGETVQLAGFGRTEDSLGGDLRFAAEAVSAMGEDWIEVDGAGRSGACVADSGGPLLRRDAAGLVTTVGVLSEGSADCVGKDRYVRLRAAADWLASFGVAVGAAR